MDFMRFGSLGWQARLIVKRLERELAQKSPGAEASGKLVQREELLHEGAPARGRERPREAVNEDQVDTSTAQPGKRRSSAREGRRGS